MNRFDCFSVIRGVTRFLMGALFLYAGAIKTIDPLQFQNDIQGYQLLPQAMIYPVAVFLPWLEVICGLSLWIGWGRRGALLIQTGAMSVFILGVTQAWIRGLDISCGCFGHITDKPQYLWWLVRDTIFLVTLIWLLWRERLPKAQEAVWD